MVQPVLLRTWRPTEFALSILNPTIWAYGILGDRPINHTMTHAVFLVSPLFSALSPSERSDGVNPHQFGFASTCAIFRF